MFSICDSSYVPLYLRWLYGIERKQYCGSEIFMDIIRQKKYRMFFMGTSQGTLQGLSYHLSQIDERINGMTFYELPFCNVEDFDYPGIAQMIDEICGHHLGGSGCSETGDIHEPSEALSEKGSDDCRRSRL